MENKKELNESEDIKDEKKYKRWGFEVDEHDMAIVEVLAKKHKITLREFGRYLFYNPEEKLYYKHWLRLSDDEHKYISAVAKKERVSISSWCNVATRAFIQTFYDDNNEDAIKKIETKTEENRDKRILIYVYDEEFDAEIRNMANMFGTRPSEIMRYSALHFDGERILKERMPKK